jgi:riboflavin kinase/FMN adenylyltransferase
MHVVSDVAALERARPTILTIGSFDGVHRGHQYLIRQVVDRARACDYDSMVLTFDPRPEVILRPDSLQLTDAAEKARIIAALGPDVLAILPFSRELAQVKAGAFLSLILDHVNLAEVWVGADFAFGHKREGTVDFLIRSGQHVGFAVHIVSRQPLDGIPISSTKVRELIEVGNVARAAAFLGHYVGFTGTVTSGFGRGAKLGFPTANVQHSPYQFLPAVGIYAGYLRVEGQRLPAAISVGYNVQFDGETVSVEAYVLDFSSDLRDREVGVEFVARIRDEQKFDTVDDLLVEMHRDVEKTRAILDQAEEPGELLLAP